MATQPTVNLQSEGFIKRLNLCLPHPPTTTTSRVDLEMPSASPRLSADAPHEPDQPPPSARTADDRRQSRER